MSELVKEDDGWWVLFDTVGVDPIGPYSTKAEAEESGRGVERFLKYGDHKSFITGDKQC